MSRGPLRDKYNVDGYPTILFATDGDFQPFGVGRTSAEIVRWVKRKLGLGVTALAPADIPKVVSLLESAAAATAIAFVATLDLCGACAVRCMRCAVHDWSPLLPPLSCPTSSSSPLAPRPPHPPPPPTPSPLPRHHSKQRLEFRHKLFALREDRVMPPATFAHLVSSILYECRFGLYFIEPVIAGLEDDDTPFICATDLIGAYEECPQFGVAGTANESLFGACESYWQPGLQPEELFETISQALLAAVDRDALSGWGATVHVM
ncbi:unnamed protein product [Closterium sp. Yama58-4]|nr:unnamed protein product [Closterium sp. Yama58-4]